MIAGAGAADWLRARAAATPHSVALLYGDAQWTYVELDQMVDGLCHHLATAGVETGHFVAALLPNRPLYVALVHALARLGAVLVPLNTRLTAPELAWQVERVQAQWLISDEAHADVAHQLPLPGSRHLIVNDSALAAAPPDVRNHAAPFDVAALQAVVFTSGTTGRPKGAVLTFANHFYSATASAYRLGVLPDDRWLSVLPLYHVGGLAVVLRSCLYGTAVDLHPRFDQAAVNQALDRKGITLISLVPTLLYRLLQTRTQWPVTLRLILLGGAAAEPELVAQANALPRGSAAHGPLPLVAPTYGLTEAASQVATMPPAEAARKPGSVGRPLLWTQVRIVDEAGQERPPGTVGKIVVSGPTVMAGYWGEEPLAGGVLHTGDMGYRDADGDLWIMQRRSDLIVSGGENVYPAEVEAVLRQHAAVAAACVVGVPHPEWGQQVAAMVEVRKGQTVSEEALLAFSRARLAGYKQPRRIRFVVQLPHTASGKIARGKVAEQLQAEP